LDANDKTKDVDPDGESAEEESSSVPNTTDNPGNSSAHPPHQHHHHQHHLHQSGHDNNKNNNNPTAATAATTNRSGSTDRSQNGEIDSRKLWDQSQLDNSKLRDDLARTRDELTTAKKKLDTVVQSPQPSSGLSDTEKKEKQALEKKLAEMEEELKLLALSENLTDQQLEHLKNDNQRLRDENGALIRVISKLSK
jgi:protein phosphatase 1 regulatory subunit 12A